MADKKLPRGVRTIGEAAIKRGRGGQLLKDLRTSRGSALTERGTRSGKRMFKADRGPANIAAMQRKVEVDWQVKKDLSRPPRSNPLRQKAYRRQITQSGVTKALKRRGKAVNPEEVRVRVARARGFGKGQQLASENLNRVLGKPETPKEAKIRVTSAKKAATSRISKSVRRTGARFSPNPRFAKLGRIAKGIGRAGGTLGIAGTLFQAYDWYKAMKKINEPKYQEA